MSDARRAGVPARIALDLIVALMFCVLVGIPAGAVGALAGWAGWLPRTGWWRWTAAGPLVLAFLCGLVVTTATVRSLLPRMKPGRYPFPLHPRSIVWLLHFSLQRLACLPAWRHLLFAFSTFRWALLRALGARAAFDMDASSDVLILDAPLMTLETGAMIGGGCTLSGHVIEHGTLWLAPVVVGAGVELGNGVLVAPGVSIGEHAVIGPDCRLGMGVSVGAFAYLGAACWVSPGTRIGAHVVVGHEVSLEADVTVGEGAVIETGARVARGRTIADGVRCRREPRGVGA